RGLGVGLDRGRRFLGPGRAAEGTGGEQGQQGGTPVRQWPTRTHGVLAEGGLTVFCGRQRAAGKALLPPKGRGEESALHPSPMIMSPTGRGKKNGKLLSGPVAGCA